MSDESVVVTVRPLRINELLDIYKQVEDGFASRGLAASDVVKSSMSISLFINQYGDVKSFVGYPKSNQGATGPAQQNKPKAAPAKKTSSKKAVAVDTESLSGDIESIVSVKGQGNYGPWTRTDVYIEGNKYSTFDKKVLAENVFSEGDKVNITYTSSQKGDYTNYTLVSIEPESKDSAEDAAQPGDIPF